MRTALLVDGNYLSQLSRNAGVPRLDRLRLAAALSGEWPAPQIYWYETYPWPREGEENVAYWERVAAKRRYLRALSETRGMRIRVPEPIPGYIGDPLPPGAQPYPDILVTIDLVRLAENNRIDRAILIWVDPTITPAVRYVREEGVHVDILHGSGALTPAGMLLRAADTAREIDASLLASCAEG